MLETLLPLFLCSGDALHNLQSWFFWPTEWYKKATNSVACYNFHRECHEFIPFYEVDHQQKALQLSHNQISWDFGSTQAQPIEWDAMNYVYQLASYLECSRMLLLCITQKVGLFKVQTSQSIELRVVVAKCAPLLQTSISSFSFKVDPSKMSQRTWETWIWGCNTSDKTPSCFNILRKCTKY